MKSVIGLVLLMASGVFGGGKYLIEFGWDEPTTGFMRGHIGEMEKTPFDGTVYEMEYLKADGTKGRFISDAWGTQVIGEEQVKQAEEDLKNTPFGSLRENFLRLDVTPGNVDLFDDFSAVEGNVRLAAKVASGGRSAGVLFDIEEYAEKLWEYPSRKYAKEKPYEEYVKQARMRGAEVMRAFEEGWKEGGSERRLTLFLTYGYSLPWLETEGKKEKLATVRYGLLAAFLDGMYDVMGDGVTLVEGFETAYGYKQGKEFRDGRELVMKKVPEMVGDRGKYLKHTSMGYGLWMDFDWRKRGWDSADGSKNYFTPEGFGKSVKMAMENADRYVWVYTEKSWWWTKEGHGAELPAGYEEAIRKVRE